MKQFLLKRRQYGKTELNEFDLKKNPLNQLKLWLEEAILLKIKDPNAMVLSTIDELAWPDSRVVLLKSIEKNGLIFFSHYNSPKGTQIEDNGKAALNFYWAEMCKQVRIRGEVVKVSRQESIRYFNSRPRKSQLCTAASSQSQIIHNRKELEQKIKWLEVKYRNKKIPCPKHWGGYLVIPHEFEFFQGRTNRLNDRIKYTKTNSGWSIVRLSP